jgi:hypothetical protein
MDLKMQQLSWFVNMIRIMPLVARHWKTVERTGEHIMSKSLSKIMAL